MSILEKINSNEDLADLNYNQLNDLCGELRKFIIENVSKTGGHLASNLGAVELSLAINRVYNSEKDRILFDVGHQCYTHKIINGRKDKFYSLRTYGGISGFPKPYESISDAFIAGHASDSVSVALGMARARTLLNENYSVVAVIGDGALTGGLAYEGLENVAASREPVVIVLNDNNMSININVGGISKMLQKLRLNPNYFTFKRKYRSILGINSKLYSVNHQIKEKIKSKLLAGNMFTDMGLEYLGPVDGHDLEAVENALRWAKEMNKPVLLHVLTVKGKGCSYAEAHPEMYHGVGQFDPQNGTLKDDEPGFCDKMGSYICDMASKDKKIVALTAAMSNGTGLSEFAKKYKNRFFDVGIAEGNAVSMAAGMAKQGLLPVFAVYSSFLQRGFDMLIHDVSLQNLHVVFCVDRAGLVGKDGETHHGVFDVAYLSSVPGMTIFCPSSYKDLRKMLVSALYDTKGPVAIRYPRGSEGEYKDEYESDEQILKDGTDVTIAAYGTLVNNAIKASDILSEKGICAEVIKINKIMPCCFEKTLSSLKKTKYLIIAEDVCESACVGMRILSEAEKNAIKISGFSLLNLGEGIVTHGSIDQLYKLCRIDPMSIAKSAAELLEEKI